EALQRGKSELENRRLKEQLRKLSHKMSQMASAFGLADGGDEIHMPAYSQARLQKEISEMNEFREKLHVIGLRSWGVDEHVCLIDHGGKGDAQRWVASLVADRVTADISKRTKMTLHDKDALELKDLIAKEPFVKSSHLELRQEDIQVISG